MQLSDDFLKSWEHIIAEVNKTDVPLECIKKVIIKLTGGKQRTVNLQVLKKQGLEIAEIESVLSRHLMEFEDDIRDVDFVVDVDAVAKIVQPETDKILKGI